MAQDLRRRLGRRIRALRDQRDLTQEQLAEKAGISWHHVSGIERAASGTSVDVLADIATAFEMSLSELFLSVDRALPREAVRVEALLAGKPIDVQRRILRLIEDALQLHEST